MFGLFKKQKVIANMQTETILMFRQFTSIDIDKALTVNERGEWGDEGYELLQIFEPGGDYSRIHLVVAGGRKLLDLLRYEDLMGERHHSLGNCEIELIQGYLDFIIDEVDPQARQRENSGLGHFFNASIRDAINTLRASGLAVTRKGRALNILPARFHES